MKHDKSLVVLTTKDGSTKTALWQAYVSNILNHLARKMMTLTDACLLISCPVGCFSQVSWLAQIQRPAHASLWHAEDLVRCYNHDLYLKLYLDFYGDFSDRRSPVIYFGHNNDIIMSTMTSQITSLTIVYSGIYSGADQRKHQSPASLAFVRGIHRWAVNSPHKGPVTRKMFPFDDVIMGINELHQWRIF